MGRLKKLSWFRRYFVKVAKEKGLKLLPIEGYNFHLEDDVLSFSTTSKVGKILKTRRDSDIIVIDRYRYILKEYIVKHIIGCLGVLIILILFATSSLFVREITFQEPRYANQTVYESVLKYVSRIGPFRFLNEDISKISQELRKTYHEYAWIGVSKRGSKLIIEIEKQDAYEIEEEDLSILGDLVATKDGIIYEFHVKRGVVLVFKDQSVRAGDVLVTGNTRFHNNEQDLKNWVRASGAVIAKVLSYETVIVPKEVVEKDYSGKVDTRIGVFLFQKDLFKTKIPYQEYYLREETILDFRFFKLIKCSYYEQTEIQTVYDQGSAEKYARTEVRRAFESERTHQNEKITFIEVLETIDNGNHYVIKLLVQAHKNIARFKRVN